MTKPYFLNVDLEIVSKSKSGLDFLAAELGNRRGKMIYKSAVYQSKRNRSEKWLQSVKTWSETKVRKARRGVSKTVKAA